MVKTLGWINVVILLIILSPSILTHFNQLTFRTRNPKFFNLIKFLRPLHKVLAIVFIFVAFIHGTMALYPLRLHTGTVLFTVAFITVILGAAYLATKKRRIFSAHKIFAGLTILALAIHLLFPWALG